MSIKKIKGLLTMAWEQFAAFTERLYTSDSKSTILKEIKFALIIFVSAFVLLTQLNIDQAYLIFFGILISLFVILFLFAYVYCLLKNPDALRTEEHVEKKLALKKGLLGDNFSGLLAGKKEKTINSIIPEDQSQSVEDNDK